MATYTYLINVLYLFLIWLVLFVRIPKIFQKGILLNCSAIAVIGLFIQNYIFYNDWAYVIGIFGTRIGIEDFLFVFSYYALAMTLNHQYLKHFIPILPKKERHSKKLLEYLLLFYLSLVIILFFFLGLHSFTSVTLTIVPPLIVAYLLYPEIIMDTLIVGFLMSLIGIGYFGLTYWIDPLYLDKYWHIDKLPIQTVYWGIPVMDVIWFFGMGVFTRMLLSLWMVLNAQVGGIYDKAMGKK